MHPILNNIKAEVDRLAGIVNAPQNLLPTYERSLDGARPHIETDGRQRLCYVVVERGEELERYCTNNTGDLLYKIFAGVTFSMASAFAATHRKKSEDFRRQLFAKQEELLGRLNEAWRDRRRIEHDRILQTHPFNDNAF